jgi:hypothetical protein
VPGYDEVKEKVKEALLIKTAKEIAGKKAEEFLAAVKVELDKTKLRDFAKAAKDLSLEIIQTPAFSRGQYLPKIGISKEFQETAFSLNDQNNLSGVVEVSNGFCILRMDSYVPVDEAQYIKDKDEFAKKIYDEKRNEVFSDYVNRARIEAKLEDNMSKLKEEKK